MQHKVCSGLWKTPVVGYNGLVFPCCSNIDLVLGDITKEKFSSIWLKKAEGLRKLHLEGKVDTIIGCKDCSFIHDKTISTGYLTDEELAAYHEASSKGRNFSFNGAILMIEPSSICNLSCVMCLQNTLRKPGYQWHHTRGPGHIDVGLFASLLYDLAESNIFFERISLFWQGEPFMHPKIGTILDLITQINKKNKLSYIIEIHTNGILLNEDLMRKLLQVEGLNIIFSQDAVTPKTYSILRQGGDFEKSIQNIKRFISLAKSVPNPGHAIRIQCIVQFANVNETKVFYNYWKDWLTSKGLRYYLDMIEKSDPPNHQDLPNVYLQFKPLTSGTYMEIDGQMQFVGFERARKLFKEGLLDAGLITEDDKRF